MGQLYKGSTKVMETGGGYGAGTGINIASDGTITNTGVTSINTDTGAIVGVIRVLPGSPLSLVYERNGTKAQFEALQEYRDDTKYYIVD